MNLYNCSDFSSWSLLEVGLKTHISTAHGNNVGSICPICGKILKTDAVLKYHMFYTHEEKVKPQFYCSLCEKSYATN